MERGNCWAFSGSEGRLTVRLSKPIRPIAFTLEHVPKSINPNIVSAPRKVSVYGLSDTTNTGARRLLSSYSYDIDGPSVQTFEAMVS